MALWFLLKYLQWWGTHCHLSGPFYPTLFLEPLIVIFFFKTVTSLSNFHVCPKSFVLGREWKRLHNHGRVTLWILSHSSFPPKSSVSRLNISGVFETSSRRVNSRLFTFIFISCRESLTSKVLHDLVSAYLPIFVFPITHFNPGNPKPWRMSLCRLSTNSGSLQRLSPPHEMLFPLLSAQWTTYSSWRTPAQWSSSLWSHPWLIPNTYPLRELITSSSSATSVPCRCLVPPKGVGERGWEGLKFKKCLQIRLFFFVSFCLKQHIYYLTVL